jgi:hypothetical protein
MVRGRTRWSQDKKSSELEGELNGWSFLKTDIGRMCRLKDYTVSWRIRIFNCIEEVPRVFFPIEFNSNFQISNYSQFNSTPYTI